MSPDILTKETLSAEANENLSFILNQIVELSPPVDIRDRYTSYEHEVSTKDGEIIRFKAFFPQEKMQEVEDALKQTDLISHLPEETSIHLFKRDAEDFDVSELSERNFERRGVVVRINGGDFEFRYFYENGDDLTRLEPKEMSTSPENIRVMQAEFNAQLQEFLAVLNESDANLSLR